MTEKGEPPWAKVCMGDKKNKVSEVGRPLVTLFCIDHGKTAKESWKIMEKTWSLVPGNRWEPCK